MTDEADGPAVPRSRLCELAEVEPRKHARWVEDGLLPKKALYGRLDLIRAVTLDELREQVGPSSMRAAWDQVKGRVVIPSRQLDIVVDLAQDEAWLASTPAELAKSLPRNTKLVVVDIGARAQRALSRFEAYIQRHQGEGPGDDAMPRDKATELTERLRAAEVRHDAARPSARTQHETPRLPTQSARKRPKSEGGPEGRVLGHR